MEALHIYAQACWHDDAFVCGNREGLLKLRDAIDKALLDGRGETDHVFTSDGEGYRVKAMLLPDSQMDTLATPYTDDLARGQGSAAVWPWTLTQNAVLTRGAEEFDEKRGA